MVREGKRYRWLPIHPTGVQFFSLWAAVCLTMTLAHYETLCYELTENRHFPLIFPSWHVGIPSFQVTLKTEDLLPAPQLVNDFSPSFEIFLLQTL